jgi:hypothetical protein
VYLHHKTNKNIWESFNVDYGGLDAHTELYIIEQDHDYKILDGENVVDRAHEIQWRDFTTTPKHRRMHIPISYLIASLDVEENARAKNE